MSIKIEIKIEDGQIKAFLKELEKKIKDPEPILKEIKEQLLYSIEQNFLEGGRYKEAGSIEGGGKRWKPLAESTIKEREKKGKWPGQVLIRDGHLAASIGGTISGNSLIISTNKPYAAIHQFGGMAGRGKKTKIPPRPYLVIQKEDISFIKETIKKHLLG